MKVGMGLVALSLAVLITLEGCAIAPIKDKQVAVELKYIVNVIPEEMFYKPPPIFKLNLETATDKDLAKWIIDGEEYARGLEKKLDGIQLWQAERLRELEGKPNVELRR